MPKCKKLGKPQEGIGNDFKKGSLALKMFTLSCRYLRRLREHLTLRYLDSVERDDIKRCKAARVGKLHPKPEEGICTMSCSP